MKDRSGSALTSSRRNASHYVALHVRGSQIARSARRPTGGITHGVVMDVPAHVYASQDIADYLSLIETVRQKLDQARQDPPDCHGSGLQAVAIASDRVDPDHGLLMRLELSSRRHRSRRGATILSTMALGALAVTAVASQVEHTDVDPDVRLLLLSQPGRYKRQGGMEAPPNRGVSGILE